MPHKYPNKPQHHGRRLLALAALIAAVLGTSYYIAAHTVAPTPTATTTDNPNAADSQTSGETLGDKVQKLQPGLVSVTQIFDGDTIEVDLNGQRETVRFIGVDTPETHDPRKPVQCYGQTAAKYTTKLLTGQKVRLEADPRDSNRDKYNRLLRYVYLSDGSLVNARLITEGYGFAYTVFDYTKIDEFRSLESVARTTGKGLWQACRVDESQTIKQTL
jgi:micrococcal nuclease